MGKGTSDTIACVLSHMQRYVVVVGQAHNCGLLDATTENDALTFTDFDTLKEVALYVRLSYACYWHTCIKFTFF